MKVIEAKDLTKNYGKIRAVDHVSFGVEEGEVFGFLGPNGAGKTTTIKMLNTLIRPSEGTATIRGYDITKEPDRVRRVIGLVPQDMTLDREITGRENLRIQGKLYGMPSAVLQNRISELLALVGLEKPADREVSTYSWGMQKRLEIIMGLVHSPSVLFLDEPTLGLDAKSRAAIWEHVTALSKESRVTIFLTTHYLEEADALCGRIAIIDRGRLKTVGTPQQLKDNLGGEVVRFLLKGGAVGKSLEGVLSSVPGVMNVTVDGAVCEVETTASESVAPKLVVALSRAGVDVERMEVTRRSMDQVFITHTSSADETDEEEDEAKALARERLMRER